MENQKIIERLDKYMALKGLNDNVVTVECGLSVGLIGKARKKYDLGKKAIDKILSTYTHLNRVWLLTGNGPMLIDTINNTNCQNNNTGNINNGTVSGSQISGNNELLIEQSKQITLLLQENARQGKIIEQLISKLTT